MSRRVEGISTTHKSGPRCARRGDVIARVLYTHYCAFDLSTPIFASIQRLARAVHIRLPCSSQFTTLRGAQSSSETRGDKTARVPPAVPRVAPRRRSRDTRVRDQRPAGGGLRFAVVDRAVARNDGSLRCPHRTASERRASRRRSRCLRPAGGSSPHPLVCRVHSCAVDTGLRVPHGGRVAHRAAVHAPLVMCAHLSTGGK